MDLKLGENSGRETIIPLKNGMDWTRKLDAIFPDDIFTLSKFLSFEFWLESWIENFVDELI